MADQADQRPGEGAEQGRHESQQAVLSRDVGIGHRAGDDNEAAQHKEQRRADTDGDDRHDGRFFHDQVLLFFFMERPFW
jgi:hypothetical protein